MCVYIYCYVLCNVLIDNLLTEHLLPPIISTFEHKMCDMESNPYNLLV